MSQLRFTRRVQVATWTRQHGLWPLARTPMAITTTIEGFYLMLAGMALMLVGMLVFFR